MQNLSAFQSAFKVEPVRFEFTDFATDGAIATAVDALLDAGIDGIYLKPLTSAERAAFEASIVGADSKKKDMTNLYARYVALSWTDDEGKPMGTAKEIGQLHAAFVAELFAEVQKLNGIRPESVEDAGKD